MLTTIGLVAALACFLAGIGLMLFGEMMAKFIGIVAGVLSTIGIAAVVFAIIAAIVTLPLMFVINYLFASTALLAVFGVVHLTFWKTFWLSFLLSSFTGSSKKSE